MEPATTSAIAAAVGAAAAYGTDTAFRTRPRRTTRSAVALVGAAAVYPLADRVPASSREAGARELATVGATLAVFAAATTLPDRAARAVVASGWILHAVFDQVHGGSPTSRLPGWYPALCAGYDLVMATQLRHTAEVAPRPPRRTRTSRSGGPRG